MKLDDFVYSGPKNAGTIGLNMTKGTLRFVTGDASKRLHDLDADCGNRGARDNIED